ncbi:response regulator [Streptomyces sp. TRM49041]|uniref:response regulator n=1 Tax=Streptomyces sp. TRM49041 TaxID=2603216 RepID=UPI0011EDA3D4|nr:response regulator [Streptomyces sp. TRM49041]
MRVGVPEQDRPYVAALGELIVESRTGGRTSLGGVAAAILLRLLFVRGQFVSAENLKGMLPNGGAAGAVHTHIGKLNAALKEHGVALPRSASGGYRLPKGMLGLDVLEFPGQVASLGDPVDAGEVARLLAMWRGDPLEIHPLVEARHWNEALKARRDLMARVSELFRRGVEVDGWNTFADRFGGDPAVKAADALHPAPRAVRRRRLLIVEDDQHMCRELETLFGDCDTTVVSDLDGYHRLMAGDPPRFHGALVDRHLTPRNTDHHGYHVLRDLQKRGIPRILITAYFPSGNVRQNLRNLTERFGLSDIVTKADRADGSFDNLHVREVVDRMLGSGPE